MWPIFAGAAGFLIGVRISVSTSGLNTKLMPKKFNFIKSLGILTIVNMAVLILVGGVYSYVLKNSSSSLGLNNLILFELVFSLAMFFFMLFCSRRHTSKYRGIVFISSIDRLRLA
jgi:uncharacterized membrane-anchored protein